MKRQPISNGNPMEDVVGFSRAVRVGPYISIGGTAPVDTDGKRLALATQPHRQKDVSKSPEMPWSVQDPDGTTLFAPA